MQMLQNKVCGDAIWIVATVSESTSLHWYKPVQESCLFSNALLDTACIGFRCFLRDMTDKMLKKGGTVSKMVVVWGIVIDRKSYLTSAQGRRA